MKIVAKNNPLLLNNLDIFGYEKVVVRLLTGRGLWIKSCRPSSYAVRVRDKNVRHLTRFIHSCLVTK